jgi:phosphoribosylformimino-5-aminoimidazole carboxamide ribotide isomerase
MIIIPAIDLRSGRCVRLTEGRRDRTTTYDADPLQIAEKFVAAGAEWLHIVDLDRAFGDSDSVNRQVAREIVSRFSLPVQFGGGLRTVTDAARMIDAGVARVVIGTMAVEDPSAMFEMVKRFGEQVCVGIDARAGEVMTRGWEQRGTVSAVALARSVAVAGIKRIVYTDIARDGTLTGLNVGQTCEVARASGLRVTASGGVASCEDIRQLKSAGEPLVDSVIIGKALYENRFTLQEALRVAKDYE